MYKELSFFDFLWFIYLNWYCYRVEIILVLCRSGIFNIELYYNEICINVSFIKCFLCFVGI